MACKFPPQETNCFKRPRSSDSDSETDTYDNQNVSKENANWPRFLILSAVKDGQSLDKLSPFAIAKALKGLAGEPKDVKVLRSGKILVECSRKQQSDNLLKSKMFANVQIEVSPHNSLNFCKGVVRSRDLKNCSEAEMKEQLKDQFVTDVKRIHVSRNGNQILTNTFILQFNIPTVPPTIKAGFLNIPVEPYVPNPLRCFKCQRFGHHKDRCTKDTICGRCGQQGHDLLTCENPLQCANCNGDHFAYSKECPKWKQEKEIQTIKVKENIPFKDARKKVESRTPGGPLAPSYANVASGAPSSPSPPIPRVETKDAECQTHVTWPFNAPNYKKLDDSVVGPFNKTKKDSSTQSDKANTKEAVKEKPKEAPKDKSKPVPQTSAKSATQNSSQGKNRDKPPKKYMRDPVQVHNPFDVLGEGMDFEVEAQNKPPPKSPPKSPQKKKITQIQPPKT